MNKPVIGILGAGKLGITLAKLALDAGYKVNIAGSGSPQKIALSVSVLANGAKALIGDAVIKESDIIILAMPLSKYKTIESSKLSGKIVIDAMNYWWEIDGTDESLYYDKGLTSTEAVQAYFAESYVVKAFNHMGYHDLAQEANNHESPKSIAYVGNDENKYKQVAVLIKDFGFEPYFLGNLKNGDVLQPGGILFGVNETKEGIQSLVVKTKS